MNGLHRGSNPGSPARDHTCYTRGAPKAGILPLDHRGLGSDVSQKFSAAACTFACSQHAETCSEGVEDLLSVVPFVRMYYTCESSPPKNRSTAASYRIRLHNLNQLVHRLCTIRILRQTQWFDEAIVEGEHLRCRGGVLRPVGCVLAVGVEVGGEADGVAGKEA